MQKITIDDFQIITDEQDNYYYSYQFTSNDVKYELCLECCFSGFDVALYKVAVKDLDYELVAQKVCTEHKGYLNFLNLDRRISTKEKAVRIANQLIKQYVS